MRVCAFASPGGRLSGRWKHERERCKCRVALLRFKIAAIIFIIKYLMIIFFIFILFYLFFLWVGWVPF